MGRLESRTTDVLKGYSSNIEEVASEGIRELLSCAKAPHTVRPASGSTVTSDKDGVAILVTLERVTKMLGVPTGVKPTPCLHNNMAYPELAMQRVKEENNPPPADAHDPEPSEYAVDQICGQRGTGNQMEYKVQWYGYSAKGDTYEAASEMPTNVVRSYWAARPLLKLSRSE